MIVIAVDCMGGDHGTAVTLPACRQFLDLHPDTQLLLVGLPDSLSGFTHPRATLVPASEVVDMHDKIEVALRKKKDSSMRVTIQQVKDGKAAAAVSAGNTGALMALARYLLKTVEGIDRPALAFALPNSKLGSTTVLDLGANVDCEPEHLFEFAIMGSALVTALSGLPQPSVGLLNVGEEVIKGNDIIKRTSVLLRAAGEAGDLNFYGNVEGNDIFKGTTDIVVCDGFVGNAVLKASEGVATMLGGFVKQALMRNILTKLVGIIAYPVLSSLKHKVDPRVYNGAALLGLNGLVFKSHGSADAFAFEHALNRAYDAARNELLDKVKARIKHAAPLLGASQPALPSSL